MSTDTALLMALALWLYPDARMRRRVSWLHTTGTATVVSAQPQFDWKRMRWWLGALLTVAAVAVMLPLDGVPTIVLAIAVAAVYAFRRGRATSAQRSNPLDMATGYDLFAAGLRSGLSLTTALTAVATEFTGPAGQALRSVADRIALGGDSTEVWEPALRHPETRELARAARRTARSGSPLATVAAELAERTRARAQEQEHARAQRSGVWISAPLGLCFLPAFLCLGVLPTILGMLQRAGVG